MQADISKESYRQTCLEKYGVDNYFRTQEFKDNLNWENILNKRYKTQKKNNSFNTSIDEDTCYSILLNYFPDIIRQYKNDKYPYNCDFYIPILDLYIEYNGSWTHGGHPFNENNEDDILLLEKWKNYLNKDRLGVFCSNMTKMSLLADEMGIFVVWFLWEG